MSNGRLSGYGYRVTQEEIERRKHEFFRAAYYDDVNTVMQMLNSKEANPNQISEKDLVAFNGKTYVFRQGDTILCAAARKYRVDPQGEGHVLQYLFSRNDIIYFSGQVGKRLIAIALGDSTGNLFFKLLDAAHDQALRTRDISKLIEIYKLCETHRDVLGKDNYAKLTKIFLHGHQAKHFWFQLFPYTTEVSEYVKLARSVDENFVDWMGVLHFLKNAYDMGIPMAGLDSIKILMAMDRLPDAIEQFAKLTKTAADTCPFAKEFITEELTAIYAKSRSRTDEKSDAKASHPSAETSLFAVKKDIPKPLPANKAAEAAIMEQVLVRCEALPADHYERHSLPQNYYQLAQVYKSYDPKKWFAYIKKAVALKYLPAMKEYADALYLGLDYEDIPTPQLPKVRAAIDVYIILLEELSVQRKRQQLDGPRNQLRDLLNVATADERTLILEKLKKIAKAEFLAEKLEREERIGLKNLINDREDPKARAILQEHYCWLAREYNVLVRDFPGYREKMIEAWLEAYEYGSPFASPALEHIFEDAGQKDRLLALHATDDLRSIIALAGARNSREQLKGVVLRMSKHVALWVLNPNVYEKLKDTKGNVLIENADDTSQNLFTGFAFTTCLSVLEEIIQSYAQKKSLAGLSHCWFFEHAYPSIKGHALRQLFIEAARALDAIYSQTYSILSLGALDRFLYDSWPESFRFSSNKQVAAFCRNKAEIVASGQDDTLAAKDIAASLMPAPAARAPSTAAVVAATASSAASSSVRVGAPAALSTPKPADSKAKSTSTLSTDRDDDYSQFTKSIMAISSGASAAESKSSSLNLVDSLLIPTQGPFEPVVRAAAVRSTRNAKAVASKPTDPFESLFNDAYSAGTESTSGSMGGSVADIKSVPPVPASAVPETFAAAAYAAAATSTASTLNWLAHESTDAKLGSTTMTPIRPPLSAVASSSPTIALPSPLPAAAQATSASMPAIILATPPAHPASASAAPAAAATTGLDQFAPLFFTSGNATITAAAASTSAAAVPAAQTGTSTRSSNEPIIDADLIAQWTNTISPPRR